MKPSLGVLLLAMGLAGTAVPSAVSGGDAIYLVTRQDPSFLETLAPYVERTDSVGRIMQVRLKGALAEVPEKLRVHLEPIEPGEARSFHPVLPRAEKDPAVVGLLGELSAGRFEGTIRKLVSVSDRSAGSPGNRAVTEWIRGELAALGYATSLQCYAESECNVIAETAGEGNGAIVLVMVHLDSTGRPFAGADDNASGVAGLLELARVIAGRAASTAKIRFIAFNGEENGLDGSTHYVAKAPPKELSRIVFALNMDMIAYNANGQFEIETNRDFEEQAKWLASKALTYTSLTPRISMPAWGSDHVPFLKKKVPTFLTIEFWETHTPCYHQECDKEETLNTAYALEILKGNLAALAEKAGIR